jgi:hypothetical protein
MARYQPRHKRGRTGRKIAAALVVLLAAALALGVAFRTQLAANVLAIALADLGLAPVELTVTEFSLSHLTVADLDAANGKVTARRISVSYGPAVVRSRQVTSLAIDGLTVRGRWDAAGLAINPFSLAPGARPEPAAAPGPFPAERISLSDTALVLDLPDGTGRLALDLDILSVGPDFNLDVSMRLDGPRLDGSLVGAGTYRPAEPLRSEGRLSIDVRADEFWPPGAEFPVSVLGMADLTAADGAVTVTLNDDFGFSGPWPGTVPLGADRAQAILEASILRPDGGKPVVRIEPGSSGPTLATDVTARISTPLGGGTARAAGSITFGESLFPEDLAFPSLAASIEDLQTPFGPVTATVNADGLRGAAQNMTAPIRIDGRMEALQGPGFSGRAFDFSVSGQADLEGLKLALDITKARGTVADADLAAGYRTTATVTISRSEAPSRPQRITAAMGPDGVSSVTAQVDLEIPQLGIAGINSALSFTARLPSLGLDVAWDGQGNAPNFVMSARDALVDGSLGLFDSGSVDAAGPLDGLSGSFSGQFTRAAVRRPNGPRLGVAGTFRMEKEYIYNQIDIRSPSSKSLGHIEAEIGLAGNAPRVTARTGVLRFGGADLAPSDVRPLGLPFIPLSGEAALDIEMDLTAGGRQSGTLFLQDIELESSAGRFERINTVVKLTSVWPPRTAGAQVAAIGLMQAGVPITDTLATFEIASADAVDISSIEMTFAGGTVTGGPLRIGFDGSSNTGRFAVYGVSMATIAQLSGLDGLDATGTLSGAIPVRIEGAEVYVLDGTLTTAGPGVIRYRPGAAANAAAAGQGGMALAMQALENFEYDSITMTVSGALNKDLQAALAIKGRNPDLYGGYPIDFNLTLSGELANVLRDSLAGYRVPETIKQQLMAFPPEQ